LLRRNERASTRSRSGLGRAKTLARCGAVEWRSKTPNILTFSREAHATMPTGAPRQKSRKPRSSHTSGAGLTSLLSGTLCRGGRCTGGMREKDSNDFCSVHVFTRPGSWTGIKSSRTPLKFESGLPPKAGVFGHSAHGLHGEGWRGVGQAHAAASGPSL